MAEMKMNSKVLILERNRFAMLVKDYRKTIYINNLLVYILKDRKIEILLTSKEIMEVLELPPDSIQKNKDNGTLHFTEKDGIFYYELSDVVRLKVRLEMTNIYQLINKASVLPTQLNK